jgi:hypothetical protein
MNLAAEILFANKTALRTLVSRNQRILLASQLLSYVLWDSRPRVIKDFLNVARGKGGYLTEI